MNRKKAFKEFGYRDIVSFITTTESHVVNRYEYILCQHNTSPFCLLLGLSLQWRHDEHDGVSNHQPHDCLLNGLFRRRSNKTSKLCVTGLCEGNSPVTGEFPAQRASNAENDSI